MRYICVSGRIPKGLPRFCAFCLTAIGDKGYVRELSTRILYCDHLCLGAHTTLAIEYIEKKESHEDLARQVN
jgi:hypothetical protein